MMNKPAFSSMNAKMVMGEYHRTPKRNKRIFWEKIAEKLNEVNNSNYFIGEACNKKFLSLTRAYYVSLWFIC